MPTAARSHMVAIGWSRELSSSSGGCPADLFTRCPLTKVLRPYRHNNTSVDKEARQMSASSANLT